MNNNILVVDDEKEIRDLLEINLINEGYNVFKARCGKEALEILEREEVNLMVLDIMMPGIDGLQVCMKIRKEYNIPIIMVSAKGQEMDKIQGLSTGADDYIVKPFSIMELLARVKAQIRRYVYLNENHKQLDNKDVIEIKGITINKRNHKVHLFGTELKLTPTEYKILLLLASNGGKVFSAEDIYKEIWTEKYFEGNNTVMAHIWRLREKLEDNPKEPKIVETVWGVGYKIEA